MRPPRTRTRTFIKSLQVSTADLYYEGTGEGKTVGEGGVMEWGRAEGLKVAVEVEEP